MALVALISDQQSNKGGIAAIDVLASTASIVPVAQGSITTTDSCQSAPSSKVKTSGTNVSVPHITEVPISTAGTKRRRTRGCRAGAGRYRAHLL